MLFSKFFKSKFKSSRISKVSKIIGSSVKIPGTYSEWVEIFDLLSAKSDDEAVLQAMLKGKIDWQSGVAERFSKKLTETINSRMNSATDKFQKDLSNAKGQDGPVVQALLALRKELLFLSQAINLPAIPEQNRPQYYQLVRRQADSIQDSLEDSAKKDRTGKMAQLIRNHKVNAF